MVDPTALRYVWDFKSKLFSPDWVYSDLFNISANVTFNIAVRKNLDGTLDLRFRKNSLKIVKTKIKIQVRGVETHQDFLWKDICVFEDFLSHPEDFFLLDGAGQEFFAIKIFCEITWEDFGGPEGESSKLDFFGNLNKFLLFPGSQFPQKHPQKQYTCKICGKSFARFSSYWSHKKIHVPDKPYKCKICNAKFAKSPYLKSHVRVHTGEKPFKCKECGMRFSQSPHLKNHQRIHSGERPYRCEVCEKSFARHSTLWNHRRIHTGEKPYKCNVCQTAFNQATHLKSHMRVHTGEKPFRCDVCSIRFADRFALKRHLAVHAKYGKISASEINSASLQQLDVHALEGIPLTNNDDLELTEVISFLPGV